MFIHSQVRTLSTFSHFALESLTIEIYTTFDIHFHAFPWPLHRCLIYISILFRFNTRFVGKFLPIRFFHFLFTIFTTTINKFFLLLSFWRKKCDSQCRETNSSFLPFLPDFLANVFYFYLKEFHLTKFSSELRILVNIIEL